MARVCVEREVSKTETVAEGGLIFVSSGCGLLVGEGVSVCSGKEMDGNDEVKEEGGHFGVAERRFILSGYRGTKSQKVATDAGAQASRKTMW